MLPHFIKRNDTWYVFRHASVSSFALPVTSGESVCEAWKKYLVYMAQEGFKGPQDAFYTCPLYILLKRWRGVAG